MAVSGNHAYVVENLGWERIHIGFQVIDVSDPANPQRLGGYEAGGWVYNVAIAGHYAYVAASSGLHIIDVSDPANPQRVGGNTGFSARGVVATEDYVFVSTDQGLAILHQFTPWTGPALSFRPVHAGPNGITLSLQGLPGLNVDIERSGDLQHWQSWTSELLGTCPRELTDPEANPWQFYRAKVR